MSSTFILYSDDIGDTWAVGDEDTAAGQAIDMIKATDTGPFFFLRVADNTIMRSLDGQTFVSFNDPTFVAGSPATPAALAYDFLADTLYIGYSDALQVFGLVNASQVDPSKANNALADAPDIMGQGAPPVWQLYDGLAAFMNGTRTLVVQKKQ